MNITVATAASILCTKAASMVHNPTTTITTSSIRDSISVVTIAGILLLSIVSSLGMALLTWFFKSYCCCCFKRSNSRDRDDRDPDYNQDHDEQDQEDQDQDLDLDNIEEGRCGNDNDNDNDNHTASTIPSVITISRNSVSVDLRWGRRNRRHATHDIVAVAKNKHLSGSSLPPLIGRRFSRRSGSGNSNSHASLRRRQRRRHRRNRSTFGLPRSPTTSRTTSTVETSPNGFNVFDHTTILTSSCDGMSLPDEECGIHTGVDYTGINNNTCPAMDPPGARLEKEAVDSVQEDVKAYPNATIQFRNPINNNNNNNNDDDRLFEDGEIDLLVDFLVHTEDYVTYPRSKLTILLRARIPETEEDKEHLQHLRAIVEDASSSGNEICTEQHQRQQQQRPPLQVFITTASSTITSGSSSMSSEEDLLRCAPTGGILVTFGSVWELPEDHPDFLKDLVV